MPVSPLTRLFRILSIERGFALLSGLVLSMQLSSFTAKLDRLGAGPLPFLDFLAIPPSSSTYLTLYAGGLILFALCTAFPRALVWMLPLIWFFMLALLNSFGKMNHHFHGFFYGSLALVLCRALGVTYLAKLRCFCTALLMIYLQTGLWKLRFLLEQDSLSMIPNILPTHIAYSIAEGSSHNLAALKLLIDHPWLAAALWLFTISLQISASLLIQIRVWLIPCLLGTLFLQHVAIDLIMGINFSGQRILLLASGLYTLTLVILVGQKRLAWSDLK